MDVQKCLDLIIAVAREAGDHARRQVKNARVDLKSADQYVTQFDKQCQDLIITQKNRYFPDHGVIAEEGQSGELLKIHPVSGDDIWWVIDPIDGTRNYAHGAPQYAVSIGIFQGGRPIAGAIYDPETDMMFSAARGQGALCDGRPMQVDEEALHTNSQVAVSGNVYEQLGVKMGILMDKYVTMNIGSAALHYAYVAKGIYAAALGWKIKLWDIAAGAAIVQEAGGRVITPEGQSRFPVDCRAYHGEQIPVLMTTETAASQLTAIING